MTKLKSLSKLIMLSYFFAFSTAVRAQECVILLHGLTRSHHSLSKLALFLERHHYLVINQDYPSTTESIKEIASSSLPPMINACLSYHPSAIHFVTHSLGGIVLQTYLQHHTIAKLGNIIMLSPPNHGSPIANLLHTNWLYQTITGPAGQELTSCATSTPNQLHLSSNYQIGIIAGTYNFIPFGNYLFDGKNDGAVSVKSAKTTTMKDFLAVPVSHPFIMDDHFVEWEILNFLVYGKFRHLWQA